MPANVLHRYAAFTTTPTAGNPAGVWIGEELPDDATMQRIASEVGFSETAFLAPARGGRRVVRYFSPEAEVPFCGHATIASGVILGGAEGEGVYTLDSVAGEVRVEARQVDGLWEASLTSVVPVHEPAPRTLVDEALRSLRWRREDLDMAIPPARAFAGAWHLVLAVSSRSTLDELDYDYDDLKRIMLGDDLTTLQLIWRDRADLFHARNPFPVGGIVEDPATGASAAALGGYLRDARLVSAPMAFTIRQGEVMGRPSVLRVSVPRSGGIKVSGNAVETSIEL